jgi:UDP-N-acetylglucosamine 2-epimerase (non-hydrolysing)
MKIIIVVGARPNFMKAAPIIAAIKKHNEDVSRGEVGPANEIDITKITHILVHTGQHYDAVMSDVFFADLDLPTPDISLGVGSASHAVQTAAILSAFERVLLREQPDVVVVVGDVNSTVACALATVKISFDSRGTRPLLAHVEAGLRSFDRSMPEEINRVVTDHMSDLLFVTEESGVRNLHDEGLTANTVYFVGNTMIDSLMTCLERAEHTDIIERLGLRAGVGGGNGCSRTARYALLTLHRPSNVDSLKTLQNILAGLEELAAQCPVFFPVHPRTMQRIREFGIVLGLSAIRKERTPCGIVMIEPLGYLEFLCLMKNALIVITDSGGIQEETTCLGVPCVTARENTERPVTVESGTNVIAGTAKEKIQAAIRRQLERKSSGTAPAMWDGQAARRIVDILIEVYCRRGSGESSWPVLTGVVGRP